MIGRRRRAAEQAAEAEGALVEEAKHGATEAFVDAVSALAQSIIAQAEELKRLAEGETHHD